MRIANLLNSEEIMIVEEIEKGWSKDKKYYIQLYNGAEYLLRKSDLEHFSRKMMEFDLVKKLHHAGLPVSEPLDIKGVEGEVQTLYLWLQGSDAEERLALLPEKEQYRLGYESGQILQKIHMIDLVPEDIEPWDLAFERKIDRNIKRYKTCGLTFDDEAFFLDAIEKYQHLLSNRPQTFQHGDYHTGNILLTDDNQLGIIDFNRWDYGDPWEEFNRIDFTAELSAPFATGQVDAYFSGKPPQEFFELLLLYISTNVLSSLPWALEYSIKEVHTMSEKAKKVQSWYKDTGTVIPSWYDETLMTKYTLGS